MADVNPGTSFLGVDYATSSAQDLIAAALKQFGLNDPKLINDVYNVGKVQGGDAAYLYLRGTDAYKQAFPGLAMRAQNGYSPITEQQYIDWKSQYTSILRNNGIPSGFYDSPDDFAAMIGNDISPTEINDRVTKGVLAAQNAPQYVKDAMFNFYGIDQGHLAAYYLDPAKSQDLLQRQATAAQIGGAAAFSGYGGLTKEEAEQLQKQGVDPGQALQRFGDLSNARQLLTALPGEAGQGVERGSQLEYVAGSPEAQQALANVAAQRKAAFSGGGDFGTSGKGAGGLADVS